MANYRIRFGTADLSEAGLRAVRPASESWNFDTGASPRLRQAGSRTQTGRAQGRRLQAQGAWGSDSFDSFLAARDVVATLTGVKAQLWWGRDDRYYKDAQVVAVDVDADGGRTFGVHATIGVTFEAGEYPTAFGTATHAPALSATGGTVNYSEGNAETLPLWTLVLSAGGPGTVTLSNLTTGETCHLSAADLPAGTVTLDRDGWTATVNGAGTVGVFDRQIPTLQPGENVITCAASGSVSVSSLAVAYPARFW